MANTRRSAHKDTLTTDRRSATKQIGIRVPARLNDRLESLAARESNSVSSVVRRLLTKALHGDEGES